MARIRSIKPEFWSDEKLSECSLSARLLFIGLISFADDEGRLDYSPARIRMQIFPCGSVKASQLSEWLRQLSERSLIRMYVIDDRQYLDIPNFIKHQRINRPTPSQIPPHSMSPHGALSESSSLEGRGLEGSGLEGNGREGNGGEGIATRASQIIPVPGLDLQAWESWITYRTKIRKPLKTASISAAQRQLAKHGGQQSAVVEQSIANGWQGLFELKAANGNVGGHSTRPYRRKTADELEAEEATRNAQH